MNPGVDLTKPSRRKLQAMQNASSDVSRRRDDAKTMKPRRRSNQTQPTKASGDAKHLIGRVSPPRRCKNDETQLPIGHVSLRFASPEAFAAWVWSDRCLGFIVFASSRRRDTYFLKNPEESLPVGKEPEDIQASLSVGIWNDNDLIHGLSGISSYDEFLEHIDQELSKIEAELVTILRVSTLVLDSKETPKNSKVQQTQELLESICGIRKRQARIDSMYCGADS
uniref:Uncharacterized protein n=1 Tax=Quercus lobata TaxID=97700 RepID=A0A7N2MCZ5_QUELO